MSVNRVNTAAPSLDCRPAPAPYPPGSGPPRSPLHKVPPGLAGAVTAAATDRGLQGAVPRGHLSQACEQRDRLRLEP
ncbi:unnamed protein product [Rangifer tarandus platyrhynchus]|uniref:Uncharacterized protein n=2 Tax=Rangifer tarandus platyrhynchus TaxID=3082113 RepID=A0ACB0F2K7_RANTA|nr:unnamed protein product [Rangifer tarandus platyrhynchus]CAI9707156.1 unnamed protein product [Rangifer tarandus platyrhynchus]